MPVRTSPKGTGKSHIYKEISPYSILISGDQTTVANLFYNLARSTVGLVGLWDVVAFDEVAGIHFKDKDGVQIMKDYMASGSFARGRDQVHPYAAMVFVGNINQPVETLVKTSHLLAPFPEAMIDSAFFDRFHAYIPGSCLRSSRRGSIRLRETRRSRRWGWNEVAWCEG